MEKVRTPNQLANLASSFVLPLAEAVEDPDTEAVLLADLGFALPPGITLVGGVRAALEAIADIAIHIADFDPDAGDSSLELVARMAPAFRLGMTGLIRISRKGSIRRPEIRPARHRDGRARCPARRRSLDYPT